MAKEMRYNGEWWTGWVGAPQWISKYQNCCWKVSAHKGTRCAGRRMHSQKFCYLSWQRLRLLCTLNMLASNLVRCATVRVGLWLKWLVFWILVKLQSTYMQLREYSLPTERKMRNFSNKFRFNFELKWRKLFRFFLIPFSSDLVS